MKNPIALYIFLLLLLQACNTPRNYETKPAMTIQDNPSNDIYKFRVPSLDGGIIDFADFRGKKILIVNTASECGDTPQYKDLEQLYRTYKDKLVIVGFPANDFGAQEPGSNEDIKAFCEKNYGVTFPMAAKISVKGDHMAPIYQWLISKEKNGVMDSEIKWNFTKFLIDENGRLITKFDTKVTPMSEEIIKNINNGQ
jgi:glutathione peroxidase